MENTSVAALSGTFAILAVVVTAFLTKRREHEGEWRKARLEHYREYIAALSGVVQGGAVPQEARARYAEATNALTLIAPPAVLEALYAFQDGIAPGESVQGDTRHEQLLNLLLSEMRKDIRPARWFRRGEPSVRLVSGQPPTPQ